MVKQASEVRITKTKFVNFSVSRIFDPAKEPFTLLLSHSYLTGVKAAELSYTMTNLYFSDAANLGK